MNEQFAGKGRRRPQLNLNLNKIHLDVENPRLTRQSESVTEFDITKILYEEFDLEELALSMAENGYFDEEPIIVVPKNLPLGFDWGKYDGKVDDLQSELSDLVSADKIEFVVVEGNRRIAAAKIMTDSELRRRLNIKEAIFPKPKNKSVEDDIRIIPAIVYPNRKDVSPYLGIRHITGLLKWDAYAKAAYLAQQIYEKLAEGKSMEESIKDLQQQIADRSDSIKKQYLCFKVMNEAEDDLRFDIKKVKNKFSLLTVALNSPSIRKYIGSPSYKDADFTVRIIPENKFENFRRVMVWIYGDEKNDPILTDSRRITAELSPVLASEEATEYLIRHQNLEEAYERSEGERNWLIKHINSATRAISYSLSFAWKYRKDRYIHDAVDECAKSINELQKMIGSND